MSCPFCGSEDVEVVSPWGGQIITSQVRCLACNTYFEAIREEFEARNPGSWRAADGPERNSEWTTSSADDR